MLNNHVNKAANELANYLKSKLPPTLMMKNLALKQVLKCDQRLFYIFELDYHNGPSGQMVIIGNYYSLDPQGSGVVIENLGLTNPMVAATVIKTFVQNHPFAKDHAIFDSQYALDNIEQEIQTLPSTLSNEDAEALAELMSIRSIHGSILTTSGELNVDRVLQAYQQLWNVSFADLQGASISHDANSIKIHYQNFDVYLSCSERMVNDELLQTSAMFNHQWPQAFECSKQSTHMFNITVDSSDSKLSKALEFSKWVAAILSSHDSCVAVLYNFYIYEPQSYLNQTLVLRENVAPVENLIWILATPKDDLVVLSTSGLSDLEHLEFTSAPLSADLVPMMSRVFFNIAQFLLANNAHLLPGNEVKLNDDLIFDVQIITSDEDGSKACLITQK